MKHAALSKDQELVEFVWDPAYTLQVKMYYYDYNSKTPRAYRVTTESAKFAREMWESLIESGFVRIREKVPEPQPLHRQLG